MLGEYAQIDILTPLLPKCRKTKYMTDVACEGYMKHQGEEYTLIYNQ